MFESFGAELDLTAYQPEPARIDLNAVNAATAYGAARSAKMDWSEYDRIDDFELNEILWRAVKGVDAPLPPAVRLSGGSKPVTRRPPAHLRTSPRSGRVVRLPPLSPSLGGSGVT